MKDWKIPFVNYPRAYQMIKPQIDEAIMACISQGDLVYRHDLKKFEKSFANFCDSKYCIGTGSCTNAMFISLKAIGIGMGHEVITTSHTYIATIDAIVATGALPVLVDVNPRTMNMDVDALEKAITPWTKALIPVHLNGRCCDMDKIMPLALEHNLFVIEDAAQAVGAKQYQQKAGSFGNTGCFSFYPAKILGCYGEGGAIVTDDDKLASLLYLMRDHGEWPPYLENQTRDEKKTIYGWGYNTILDNIQAAVLNVKLEFLEKKIRRRRQIARMYDEAFFNIKALDLPPAPTNWEYYDVFQNYVIRYSKRDLLEKYLNEHGIETIASWKVPNHKQKGLKLNFKLPETERISMEVLSLSMYPELTDEEVLHVIGVIRRYFS